MGVIFNILLAWVFISIPFFIGTTSLANNKFPVEYKEKKGVEILAIEKNTVAEKIGLEAGEFIVKISSGDKFVFKKTAKEYRDFLKNNPENLKIVYQKDYKKIEFIEQISLI
jgi:C-terminal processing protease CtpA/Prc